MSTGDVLLLRGGLIFDVDDWTTHPGDVLIHGDRIVEVGQGIAVPPEASLIHASEHVLVPGFINSHTHSQNNLTKGSGDKWTLEMALSFGGALNGARRHDDHYVSAMLGALEMLRGGITSTYDLLIESPKPTVEGIEAVLQAYEDVGLRAIVAPAVADKQIVRFLKDVYPHLEVGKFDIGADSLASTHEILDLVGAVGHSFHHKRRTSIVRLGVSPTIPILCSDELIEGLRDLASEWDVSIHTHLAETEFQAVSAVHAYGDTLLQRLKRLGVLDGHFIGAHGVWLTPGEADVLAEAEAVVVHNPASNLKLGSGVAGIKELQSHGVRVALGTDGCISSDNLNMFDALKIAALGSRSRLTPSAEWLGATDVLGILFQGGADVMGLSGQLGRIAPGYLADLIVLNTNCDHLSPLNALPNQLVYSETGDAVDMVIVAGRIVVKDGKVLSVDENTMKERGREATERLRKENRTAWELASARAPHVENACATVTRSEPESDFLCLSKRA